MSLADLKAKYAEPDYSAQVEEIFNGVFNSVDGVDFIAIVGTTPGFNDGDACTHSHETLVNTVGSDCVWSQVQHAFDMELGFDEDQIQYASEYSLENRRDEFTEHELSLMESVVFLDSFGVSHILNGQYGTDWALYVTRDEEGNLNIQQTEYHDEY